MKTLLLSITLFANSFVNAQTNWTLANSGIQTDFWTLDFIKNGSTELYAIGYDGNGAGIYKTTDNGLSWSNHSVVGLTNHDAFYISGINTGSTYLINAQASFGDWAIYSSTDMTNWTLSNTGIPSSFRTSDFAVVNSNQIYAIGANFNGTTFIPSVYYSDDGGSTWGMLSSVGLAAHDYLYTASIYVNNRVLMNAHSINPQSDAIYSSSDGVNWNPSNNGKPNNFETSDFMLIDNNNVWAFGGVFGSTWTAGIYTSIDGGVNWSLSTNIGMENHDYQYLASKEFNNYLFCSASSGSGTAVYSTINTASINGNGNITSPEIVKIVDAMGRETKDRPNTLMIYIYTDGTTKKVFRVE